MNSNNNQISQSENRWQPKASNLGIQNLYQKIQEAARDRNWAKIKELTEEIEKLEKEEERKAEKYERDLQQFEEIIRRQKLKKLEEELGATEERHKKIKKEISKLTKKVNFNKDVEVRDTHTREETPEIEKQEIIQVIGKRIEEEPTREELEKEFEEENNQLRKGFKINRQRYLELKKLLGIIEKPKEEDQWITKPITLEELSETIQEESEIPQIEENVTTEEIKEIIGTTINYKEPEEIQNAEAGPSNQKQTYAEVLNKPITTISRYRPWLRKLKPNYNYTGHGLQIFKLCGFEENKNRRNYWCGCISWELKEKYKAHKKRYHFERKYDYHCCKCKRPGAPDQIENGAGGYHQLCKVCHKDETWKAEDQWWWHQECFMCLIPMETIYDVGNGRKVCSEECKYAWCSVKSANDFTHIPTRIWSYKFREKCRADYIDVAVIAEAFYKRKHPDEELIYDRTRQRDQLSWDQMAQHFAAEIAEDNRPDSPSEEETREAREYLEVVQQSWNDAEVTSIQKIPAFVDLRKDPRFKNEKGKTKLSINLCCKCLMVFETTELEKHKGKLFCKNSNHNKGCFEELDTSPSEETDPSPNNGKGKDKAVDPWEQ